jgi:ADP-glucose pyrophosphorylase
VRRAILDKNVRIPPGARIGVDPEEDRARGLTASDSGILCLGKGDPVGDGPVHRRISDIPPSRPSRPSRRA